MKTLTASIIRTYESLDGVFTTKEAWTLFKYSAFLETIGWFCLITGILFSHYEWPYYDYVLPIAGSIHGIFYISYTLIVFFVHRSLKWSFWRFVIAESVSNVPLGALIFELWVARRRTRPHAS